MPARAENDFKIDETTNNILKEMPDYVVAWHDNLHASQRASSTRLNYVRNIRKFLKSIDEDVSNIKPEQINKASVTKYFISIGIKQTAEGNTVETSGSHQQTVYSAMSNFLEYLSAEENLIPKNYIKAIDRPFNNDLERIKHNRIHFTTRDFKLVLHHAEMQEDPVYRYRDAAMLRVFMSTGMRETALRILNISDIDFENKQLVTIDKRKTYQVYDLNKETIDSLEKWLEYRKYFSKRPSDALFLSYQGERISTKGISKIVEKHFETALGKHVSPHKIRGGLASIMFEKTGNIETVRRALGHKDVSVTQRYITTKNDERKKLSELMNF